MYVCICTAVANADSEVGGHAHLSYFFSEKGLLEKCLEIKSLVAFARFPQKP